MKAEQLIGHDMFHFLRPDQMRIISNAAERVSLKAGHTIFRRGDKAEHFFIVLEGQVALRLQRKEGVSLLIDEVKQGAVFGSCVCFQFESYTLTAQCTEDSKLLKIQASALKELMDEDMVVGYAVQSLISQVYFKRYLDTMQKLQAIIHTIPLEAI